MRGFYLSFSLPFSLPKPLRSREVFADIQTFTPGECWSGPEPSASEGYDIHGLADVSHDSFCTNLDFQKCQSDNEYCSGGAWTMSVYVLGNHLFNCV